MATKKPAAKVVAKKTVSAPAKKAAVKPVAKKANVTAPAKPVAKVAVKKASVKAAPAKPQVKEPIKKVAVKASKPAPKAAAKVVATKKQAVAPTKPVAKKPAVKVAPKKAAAKPAAAKLPTKAPAKPTKVAAAPKPKVVKEPKVKKVKEPVVPVEKVKKVKEPKAKKKNVVRTTKLERQEVKRPVEVGPPPIVAYKAPAQKITKTEVIKGDVKVPKLTTKAAVEYNPGYTTLQERESTQTKKTNEPLVRYSDADLNEFRDLITKKLDDAKRELGYLQGLITRKDDMSGDDSENRATAMDDGGMSMEREQLNQMAGRQVDFIDKLEKALIRISNKTYGICRESGKLIDKNRLRAVPHATLSLEAKLGLVKRPSND